MACTLMILACNTKGQHKNSTTIKSLLISLSLFFLLLPKENKGHSHMKPELEVCFIMQWSLKTVLQGPYLTKLHFVRVVQVVAELFLQLYGLQ
jgi:hypothetical protein